MRVPEISRAIGEYQVAILGVSAQFRGNPDVAARLQAMKPYRQSVTDLLRDPLTDRLLAMQGDAPEGMDMTNVAHNLTRWDPAEGLLQRYF